MASGKLAIFDAEVLTTALNQQNAVNLDGSPAV
jgi:hypothetical protein